MFLGLPTFYDTGTASVDVGGTVVTFQAAALGTLDFPAVLPGDLFMDPAQPEIPPQRIASIDYAADPQTATLAFAWPGAAMVEDDYEIRLVGNIERSTAQTRRYLELLGQIGYTGIAVNAFGDFADRDLYDDMVQGFTFLSLDGDGTVDSPAYIYVKQSSASGDWSEAISFIGGDGPPGPTGQAAIWRSGSGVPAGGLGNNGDMYIDTATGDVYGPKTGGSWGAIAINIKGPPGNDGIDGTSMLSRVRVVSEVNVDIANLNNGDTIDGVVVATNWLVLLAGQTNATQNGVYVVGATAGSTVRAAAFDTFDELPGTYFSVMQGTANADTLWKCSSDLGGTIGVDDLIFELFASSEGFMTRTYESYALNSGVTYTLPSVPSSDNALDVYVGGILQPKEGVAYTFTGTTLTLSEDPGTTDLVEVYIFEALAMGAVPAGSVGSAEINAAQAAAIRVVLGILGTPREVLTANRTYYVRTDGNDANNGLTNTSGGAFLTIQKALDVSAALDLSIYAVTINVADGTYNEALVAKPYVGAGPINLVGNVATPANVVINSTGPSLTVSDGIYTIDGFKPQATTWGLRVSNTGTLRVNRMNFGACGTGHMAVTEAGYIALLMDYTISGGGSFHMFATTGGTISADAVLTVTATGTPAITTLISAARLSKISIFNITTWAGAITTTRYSVTYGALVDTGAAVLPGSGGVSSQGGNYNGRIGGARELLTANRTYYVRTDGSNNNDGLANTSGGAFLTVQKAIDVILSTLDLGGQTVTVQVADGTYTGAMAFNSAWTGGGAIVIQGNSGTPANVIFNTTAGLSVTAVLPGTLTIKDCTFTTTNEAIWHQGGGVIQFQNIRFGACGIHIRATGAAAIIRSTGAYSIVGGAAYHAIAQNGASITTNSLTVTITGTPAFSSAYAAAQITGMVEMQSVTFSGSATGSRYSALANGVVYTGGQATTYLPGNAAGTGTNSGTAPYGLYA